MGFIPIIFLLIVLMVILAYRSRQGTIATWKQVATTLGLTAEVRNNFSRPVLTGNLNGLPVKIDSYTQRSGNNSTTYTRYQVRYRSVGFDFKLSKQGGLAFIGKLFGIEDVQVGDPVFDGAFKVKTSDQSRLVTLLTPSVRSGLFRLLASYPTAVISEDHIGMTVRGFEKDGRKLASTIQRLVATAQLLTAPSAGVSDQNVTDRASGLLTEVADRMRQAVEENPDDIDQRIFEVETLAAAGQDKAAAERVAELEKIAPADPDVAGWKDALRPPAPTPRKETVDADEVANELFGGNDLSFETRGKFNAQYAGANVTWEGRVKDNRRVGDSVTVTVTVATVANDLYGNTDIDVLVDTAASAAPEIDAMVTVSGMLTTIDPLMRNLYIENGSIS